LYTLLNLPHTEFTIEGLTILKHLQITIHKREIADVTV
jgi:hypothetical protein